MYFKYFTWLCICHLFCINSFSQNTKNNRVVIIAEYSTKPNSQPGLENNKDIETQELYRDSTKTAPRKIVRPMILGKKYIWQIETSKKKIIHNSTLFAMPYIATPGDSIFIRFQYDMPEYSGIGSIKCQLQQKILQAQKKINHPGPVIGKGGKLLISLNEYLQLSRYYNAQIKAILPIIEAYQYKLNNFDYTWIKCNAIYSIEKSRYDAFIRLPLSDYPQYNITCIPIKDITAAWDSTMYKPWAKWLRTQNNIPSLPVSYFYGFSRHEVWKKHGFVLADNDTLASKPMRVKMYYNQLVNNYKGLRLEETLCYLLDEEVTQEMGSLNPVAQNLLKDYYKRSKFPQYKKWIQSLEAKRQWFNAKNGTVPFFQLYDTSDKIFTERNINGKFTVINFWYSGCENCKEKKPALQALQEKLKNDTNVIFLNVSVDVNKQKWLKNKDTDIYKPKRGIQLYTGGNGKNHALIKDLNITRYPSVILVIANGAMIINKQEPDLTKNNGKWLEDIIKSKQTYAGDGPYIITEDDGQKTYYISGGEVNKINSSNRFEAATDMYDKKLEFSLQREIKTPLSEYPAPQKMLVLSDIEGNFMAFRKLLQANKVIDDNFNWTFDKGHLVFSGDMFDRGEQVTECLWLIYSLEEKAKAAGGMVHFILGNHEIMNLNGQDRYVKEKYKKNYKLLGKTLSEVYNEKSELGRWLRCKNIVEKIGNNLFCHGGISPHVSRMFTSLEEINKKARPYYDRSTEASKSSDEELKALFNTNISPFWYRQYYTKDVSEDQMGLHTSIMHVDSTCKKFGVNRIITGHTIVADTISIHFGGKIINTDTHHAEGKSEALLIENTHFFRVNSNGNKILLFKEEDHQLTNRAPANSVSR